MADRIGFKDISSSNPWSCVLDAGNVAGINSIKQVALATRVYVAGKFAGEVERYPVLLYISSRADGIGI
jgi:hypothetical protein